MMELFSPPKTAASLDVNALVEQVQQYEAEVAGASDPVAEARAARERGDHVLQVSFEVMNQCAVIFPMVGGTTTRRETSPTALLNAVSAEGWELIAASFVFQQYGQESRDKFLSSGQQVAISGATVGYYVFRRA